MINYLLNVSWPVLSKDTSNKVMLLVTGRTGGWYDLTKSDHSAWTRGCESVLPNACNAKIRRNGPWTGQDDDGTRRNIHDSRLWRYEIIYEKTENHMVNNMMAYINTWIFQKLLIYYFNFVINIQRLVIIIGSIDCPYQRSALIAL